MQRFFKTSVLKLTQLSSILNKSDTHSLDETLAQLARLELEEKQWTSVIQEENPDLTTHAEYGLQKCLLLHFLTEGKKAAVESQKEAKDKAQRCFANLHALLTKFAAEVGSKQADPSTKAFIDYLWGEVYVYGLGMPVVLDKGIAHLKSAADSNNTPAMFLLSKVFSTQDFPADFDSRSEIRKYWSRANSTRDTLKALELGKQFGFAKGWLIKASDAGNIAARYGLAQCHFLGDFLLVVEPDRNKASELLRQNVVRGHAQSAYELATRFIDLDAIREQEKQQKAALNDEFVPLFTAGVSMTDIIETLHRRALSGSSFIAKNLYYLYLTGDTNQGIAPDAQKARFYLGVYNSNLQVVPALSEALELLKKAAELGHAEAALDFGKACRTGDFRDCAVSIDANSAIQYLTRAQELGSCEGALMLGEVYEGKTKLLVEKDAMKAIACYEQALRLQTYYFMLEKCAFALASVPGYDMSKLTTFLEERAKNDCQSLIVLGNLHLHGRGNLSKDPERAESYFQRVLEDSTGYRMYLVAQAHLSEPLGAGPIDAANLRSFARWHMRGVSLGEDSCIRAMFDLLNGHLEIIGQNLLDDTGVSFAFFNPTPRHYFDALAEGCKRILGYDVLSDNFYANREATRRGIPGLSSSS